MKLAFIDLFSGIGGFRLGLEQIGFKCVWSCDNDKYANQVYTKRFGEQNHHSSDIRGVDPRDIPDFDLLCAGFPCQAFSVAGQRKGFKDPRGTLFWEILRIAKAKKPVLLLLENVKGLLSHDRGATFATILSELGHIGYWCEYQVLNSKYFGVPQNRQRVFIIGHLRGKGGREIFPIVKDGEETNENGTVVRTLQGGAHSGGMHSRMTGLYVIPRLTPDRKEKYQHGRRFKEEGDPMFTLTGQDVHGVAISEPRGGKFRVHRLDEKKSEIQGCSLFTKDVGFVDVVDNHPKNLLNNFRIRRLTPTECERLQGFPDGWTAGVSDTQRYKLLGNAVTVSVIEFLGKRIFEIKKEMLK